MKNIILSADGDRSVYSVPDIVADNLMHYCSEFEKWLWNSPKAKKYRIGIGVCYDETDFIYYLNTFEFPNEKSVHVKTLEWVDNVEDLPEEYNSLPYFNF